MQQKLATSFLLLLLPHFAFAQENLDYFKALAEIQAVPEGYNAVAPVTNIDEYKKFINLYKKSDLQDFDNLAINNEGKISNDSGDAVLALYKGHFSNESVEEYALITMGGTLRVNNVYVYQLKNGKLIDADLTQVIEKSFNLEEGTEFYLWTAAPFAITKEGKTYLRFMKYPGEPANYDKTQLQLCTYYWQKNTVKLSGPNFDFSGPKKTLSTSKKCIG